MEYWYNALLLPHRVLSRARLCDLRGSDYGAAMTRLVALLGKQGKLDARLYERDGRARLSERQIVVGTICEMQFALKRAAVRERVESDRERGRR